MKRAILATMLSLATSYAGATVLTFDNIPGGSTQNTVGNIGTYGGFTFGCAPCSINRLDWIDTISSSWNFGAVSGDFTMLNNYGGTGIIRAVGNVDFTFDGMWAETWANTAPRTQTIRGFNNGSEIWASTIQLGSTFSYFGGVSGAIDELRLDLGNHFLVDNLALNETTVPEPASLGLLGLGLAGLYFSRRREQN